MRKIILLFCLILTIIFLYACDSSLKRAIGPEDQIIVIADSIEYYEMKPTLEEVFEKIIYTPQPEKLFSLRYGSLSQLDERYDYYKNLILIAPLNSNSNTAEYIKAILDSTVEERVKEGKIFYITKEDMWRRDQLLMILTAPTFQELEMKMLNNKENLLYQFQKISDERLYQSLYNAKYERKDIEAKFLKNYGWVIYVQADYITALDKPEDNFVWLRRSPGSYMERWIFVHWIENAAPSFLNPDSIRIERNKMTKKYYRSMDDSSYVEIAEDYYTTSEVNFKGRYALLTQGLWRMTDKTMGGPFVNYTFYDEQSGRIYMLDGSIFAPKFYKRNLIQQVDVTLKSFMTEKEISDEKKENLLDELDE